MLERSADSEGTIIRVYPPTEVLAARASAVIVFTDDPSWEGWVIPVPHMEYTPKLGDYVEVWNEDRAIAAVRFNRKGVPVRFTRSDSLSEVSDDGE